MNKYKRLPRSLQDVYKGHANTLLLQRHELMHQSKKKAAVTSTTSRMQPSTPAFLTTTPRTVTPPTVDHFEVGLIGLHLNLRRLTQKSRPRS